MGGRLLLFLLIPSLIECAEKTTPTPSTTIPPPAPSPYSLIDRDLCMKCPIPPTIPGCGTMENPHCRTPYSMPYKGQNHQATCARLRCPDTFDMFVNTAGSGRDGDRIVDYTPRRVVLNPQTIICARDSDTTYKFMIRDGQGHMRPVNDVQCRQNNFPRHSCTTDGFLKQTCTKREKCTPIGYLSDYGGNKCNEPFKLMMRFSDAVDWELVKKLSCDRELGWWRIHFPNGTWMHTRYGTIATCVKKEYTTDPADNWMPILIRGIVMTVVVVATLAVSFNAYMCRSVVIWEGSNWQRLWNQDLLDKSQQAMEREIKQNEIVKGIRQQNKWHKFYQNGLYMDLRQYDIMQNMWKSDIVHNMEHWTLLDDFDYYAQQEEARESQA